MESEKLVNIDITEENVKFYIDKVHKSPGSDAIHAIVLKELKDILAKPLSDIFNSSINSGEIPVVFKRANVTPIFKKGNKKLPSNYRPISLTSLVGKLQESIIRDHLVNHLNRYNLIRASQHGFRNNKSCLTNLLEFFNKVVNDYDKHGAVDIIYLDFRKAFDLVPHKKLLLKIKAHGIDGNVLKWIEEWLTERKQRVVINGIKSSYVPVTSGVPQGSVLGPILFLIYINDLDANVINNIAKFADDTKISGIADNLESCESIQNDLNNITEWSTTWGMEFNVEKCKTLHIGNKNINFPYNMGGNNLSVTAEQKDLGIIVDNKLKFSKQCVEASKKANKMLGFIARTFEYRSKDIILPLYKSLVRPHLEYAVQCWSPHYVKDITVLERVQRRATKLIPAIRNLPYSTRLQRLHLHSLELRRIRGQMIEVFKILNGFDEAENLIVRSSNSVTRTNGYKLRGIRFKTDIAKKNFSNRIVNAWNLLPASVVSSDSINQFKNRLDKFFESDKFSVFSRVCELKVT